MAHAIWWFVRLRAPDSGREDHDNHERWMAENPASADDYQSIDELWDEIEVLDSFIRDDLAHLNRYAATRTHRRLKSWVAGTVALAALICLWIFSPFLLTEGKIYETREAEQRQITLDDGSRIHLNTASTIRVQYTNEAREIILEQGEGVFDVEPDRNRPFIVRGGQSQIVAIGTRFSIYKRDRNLTVTVLEGRVAALPDTSTDRERLKTSQPDESFPANQADPAGVLIGPNHQARLDASGHLEELRSVDAYIVTSWTDGKLVFEETPLRDVVREMSRYIPGEVSVASDVPNHPVTGIIQIRGADTMVDLLTKVAPIIAVKESARSIVLYDNSATSRPPNNQ